MQKRACGEGAHDRTVRSGGRSSTAEDGASSVETLNVGTSCAAAWLGTWGSEAGVGLAAEIRQQELLPGASWTVIAGACALIMGQCGVQSFFAAMCSQHEASVVAGAASRINASMEATNLKRHVMVLA